jgi:hypothetical protein
VRWKLHRRQLCSDWAVTGIAPRIDASSLLQQSHVSVDPSCHFLHLRVAHMCTITQSDAIVSNARIISMTEGPRVVRLVCAYLHPFLNELDVIRERERPLPNNRPAFPSQHTAQRRHSLIHHVCGAKCYASECADATYRLWQVIQTGNGGSMNRYTPSSLAAVAHRHHTCTVAPRPEYGVIVGGGALPRQHCHCT